MSCPFPWSKKRKISKSWRARSGTGFGQAEGSALVDSCHESNELEGLSIVASWQFPPLENKATLSRQRREGCRPGATPRGSRPGIVVRPERAGDSCALAGRTTVD